MTGILFVLLSYGSVMAEKALTASCPSRSGETVTARYGKDGYVLSLPGSWDLTKITLAMEDADAVLTVNFLPDSKILGDTDYDLEATGAYLEQTAFLNVGLSIWFKGRGLYFKTDGTAGLFRKFFPETDPDTVFTWCSPVFEFTIGRAYGGKTGEVRSFAGDRETVDGGIHADNFKLGMAMALRQ